MKFCHVLETTSHDNPEYRRLFLFYKQMKKQLKRLPAAGSGASGDLVLAAEGRFVEILVQQITALNNFRMERQALCVRTLSDLRGRMHDSVGNVEERQQIYQTLVNFHGQALLLMHYSILAYTAIVKLLKKHHKRTGILLQAPHLRDVLSQPAWSTEVVTGLISQAEAAVRQLQEELFGNGPQPAGASNGAAGGSGEVERAGSSASFMDNQVLLNTLANLNNEDEDSGEDSMLEAASSEDGEGWAGRGGGADEMMASAEGSTSVCSNAQQSSHAAGSSGDGGSAAGGSVSGHSQDPAGAPVAPVLMVEGAGAGGSNEPFANQALVQQMEAALRTWEYLQTHASTPSTVLQR